MTSTPDYASLAGYLGLGFSLASMLLKENRSLLKVNFFAAILWGINGYLLGSNTSLWVQMVGGALTLIRLYCPEQYFAKATIGAMLFVCIAALASWQGWQSLPVTLATLSLIAAIGLARGIVVRVLFLTANTFFLIHASIYGAHEQLIACALTYLAIAVGIARMRSTTQSVTAISSN